MMNYVYDAICCGRTPAGPQAILFHGFRCFGVYENGQFRPGLVSFAGCQGRECVCVSICGGDA